MTNALRLRESETSPCVIQERDRKLVTDLFLHRVMSRDQIIALGFFGSVPRCNSRLRRLVDHGFVKRYEHASHGSGSQSLYFAGRAAIRMVAEVLDIPIEEVTWQVSRDPPAMFLEHTLGLVELRIAFTKLASHQKWSEFEWLPEPLCRHEYSVRNGTRWACQILKPDAFACWKIGAQEFCHFIELDLGHVSQRVFRSKVQGYQRYHSLGLFTEAYGSSSFSVLVITTGQRRIESLLSAVQPGLSPFFLFATFSSLRELGPAGASWRSAEGHASPFGGNQ